MAAQEPTRTRIDDAVVLLVDDEPSVLTGLRRVLHGSCIVHTESDPVAALELLEELPDLAVVVSDMRMPVMDGAEFLANVRARVPDVTRVLLTGHTDVDAAVAAINDGQIFRFLWKPVSPEMLLDCLSDAAQQHRLVTAERELLERTLHGSVRALLETLSLANPLAFSRAERIKALVTTLADRLGLEDAWEVELAAMLSQLGAVTLPTTITERLHRGERLSASQQELVDKVPTSSLQLIADVPRLERVRDAIRLSAQRYDGRGPVVSEVGGDDLPIAARLVGMAVGYDPYGASSTPARIAMEGLRADRGRFDPQLLDALEQLLTRSADDQPVDHVPAAQLEVGHVLAADLMTIDGVLLCGRGQTVTERLLTRIANWSRSPGLVEPVQIMVSDEAADTPDAPDAVDGDGGGHGGPGAAGATPAGGVGGDV